MKETAHQAKNKRHIKNVFLGLSDELISVNPRGEEEPRYARGGCSKDCHTNCGEGMTFWGSRDIHRDRN